MAYPTPTIVTSGATFANLQAGGLTGVLELIITASTAAMAPVVDANGNTTNWALQNTRAAERGNLQEVYDRAAISLDRWLRGDPMALNAIETQLVYAQTAFMAIAEAFTNIGALVDANPGSLHPSTSGGVGTVSSTVRTWP